MVNTDKIRENRLRRMAERQGFRVTKSRRRDPRAVDYGLYNIIDPELNAVIAGVGLRDHSMTLGDVEEWLTSDKRESRQSTVHAAVTKREFRQATVRFMVTKRKPPQKAVMVRVSKIVDEGRPKTTRVAIMVPNKRNTDVDRLN